MNQPRGRPFPNGNTIGRGRPKGSRNKAKAPAQELLEQYAEPLTKKCITLAMQGDKSAMRICMSYLSPVREEACVQVKLAPIRNIRDLDNAAEKVTQSIARGKITPLEGEKLMNILEARSKILQVADIEIRLTKLEEIQGRDGTLGR
jgi:hypothetical protein